MSSVPVDEPVAAVEVPNRPAGVETLPRFVSHHRDPVWKEIWERRELLRQLVTRDIRLRYHQAIMGFLWALLMPCLVLGASMLVRSLMGAATGSGGPSLAATAFKAWAWAFFVGSINFATNSLLSNINLISKMYFPREVLPVAAVGAQAFDGLVGFAFLWLLSPLLHVDYTWQLLWIPVLLGLLVLLTVGPALVLSAGNIFYRDVKYLVQVAVTFGIFATPVFYGFPDLHARARLIVALNPMSAVLEGFRVVVSGGSLAHTVLAAKGGGVPLWTPYYLLIALAEGLVVLVLGVAFFRRRADRFAELA